MKKKPPLKHPSQNHKFWDGSGHPVAIAHRGGAGLYTVDRFKRENTLEVFRAAVKLGYDYLELDVTATADNIPIVLHVTTDRFEAILHKPSAPNAKKLQALTYRQLKSRLDREIPTLAQILKQFPDTKFLIDSKTDRAVEPIANEIIRAKAFNRVFLNSFYIRRITKLKELLGNNVTYGVIVGRYPKMFNRRLKALIKGQFDSVGLTSVVLPYKFIPFGLVSQDIINLMHKKGFKVLLWTPNTASRINRAIDLGADGIISDDIKLLKEIINKQISPG